MDKIMIDNAIYITKVHKYLNDNRFTVDDEYDLYMELGLIDDLCEDYNRTKKIPIYKLETPQEYLENKRLYYESLGIEFGPRIRKETRLMKYYMDLIIRVKDKLKEIRANG